MRMEVLKKVFKIVSYISTALFVVSFFFLLWLLYKNGLNGNFEIPSSFSGVLSGVFTGLAFLGVVLTLYFQDQQSKEQKVNYERQLQIAKVTYDRQMKDENIRRFENTFFQMLSLHQEIVKDLSFTGAHYVNRNENPIEVTYNGREVFDAFYRKNIMWVGYSKKIREIFYNKYRGNIEKGFVGDFNGILQEGHLSDSQFGCVINHGMRNVIQLFGLLGYENVIKLPLFDHYFRHLYRIVKFIDKAKFSDIDEEDFSKKYEYIGILRGTLSRYELIWLFYNGLSENGYKNFKPLIEEYALLKNIRTELLAESLELKEERIKRGYGMFDFESFPENDFEFFTTTDPKDESKYYIGAFYKRGDELNKKFKERKQRIGEI